MASEVTRRDFLGTAGTVAAAAVGTTAAMAAGAAAAAEAKPIKIIAVSCSPRKGQGTAAALQVCLEAVKEAAPGAEVELIELAELKVPGEPAVGLPLEPGQKDDFPAVAAKLTEAKVAAIIIGTPVYFGNMSYLCKAFLDRWMFFRKNNFALKDKVAGVVAVGGARNGGVELTIRSVQTVLMSQQMLVVGDGPPTGHWGGTVWSGIEGGVAADQFGLSTVKNLGRRVAEVALRLGG